MQFEDMECSLRTGSAVWRDVVQYKDRECSLRTGEYSLVTLVCSLETGSAVWRYGSVRKFYFLFYLQCFCSIISA